MRTNIIRNADVWSIIFHFFPHLPSRFCESSRFAEDIYKSVKTDRWRVTKLTIFPFWKRGISPAGTNCNMQLKSSYVAYSQKRK